jgi:hypothetical protein
MEDRVQATAKEKHREAMQAWFEGGEEGSRPQLVALDRADPTAYHISRLMAIFPNLLNAIQSWHNENPNEPRITGRDCKWGESLGNNNEVVQKALRSENAIKESFIWDIAREACEGSAKVDHVMDQIQTVTNEETIAPHPDPNLAAKGEKVSYKSKYVVVTALRLARALLWCRIIQEYGEKPVIMAGGSSARLKLLPKWQKYWDVETNTRADDVCILVAGLGVICQSITLAEGHVLEALEPHPNNSSANQASKRQHRLGQPHHTVWTRYLTLVDSLIDGKIATKNKAKNCIANDVLASTV